MVLGTRPDTAPGALYAFRLDVGDLWPDPASRFQPAGPSGPSQVVDPTSFAWGDEAWAGVAPHEHALYELHVGTFTPEGTWQAAEAELAHLAGVGVTTIEVMPVADFAGRFGWGYDGVDLFAPTRLYGHPDDMRRFVDTAHRLGLAVILDVVYNHLGPARLRTRAFRRRLFHRPLRERVGCRPQPRRSRQRASARVLRRQRRLLDR